MAEGNSIDREHLDVGTFMLVSLARRVNNDSSQFMHPESVASMKFFGRDLSIGKLEIDHSATSSESPEIQKRIDRIEDNYARLDEILSGLEIRIESDQRLRSTFALDLEPATDSADPKKPR